MGEELEDAFPSHSFLCRFILQQEYFKEVKKVEKENIL